MTIPTKTLKNGFQIPSYGMGTWKIGGGKTHDPNNNDEADILAIKSAIDLGVTHIDTAEAYAAGYAEILVGKSIVGYDRKNLFIASKVIGDHLHYDDLLLSARNSLKRLNTGYLDLFYIHQYNPSIPLKETMKAMTTLVEEGLIKNVGVSNFTAERLEEAQSVSKYKIVANQVHYSLKFREPERKGLVDYCQKNDVILVAWRPIRQVIPEGENFTVLKEMSKKYGKSPAQIALNWLISQVNVVTVSKTSSPKHLEDNLGALHWKMAQEDVEKLRKEFPEQEDISDTIPLG